MHKPKWIAKMAALAFPRLPQEIVLGAMDLSIREKGSTGQEIFRLTGNATSGGFAKRGEHVDQTDDDAFGLQLLLLLLLFRLVF